MYIPKSRYKKAMSTDGTEFVEVKSRELYKGFYIETFKGKYFAGKTPEENGPELEKIKKDRNFPVGLLGLFAGFFLRKLTQSEKDKGVIKRNFIQDKNNSKILETDTDTYNEAKSTLVNHRFVQVDWIIKGPIEDQMFGKYPFEGAASKNKKTILAAEKDMPGISLFVTNYSLMVEEPINPQENQLSSETEVQKDALVELDNSRKARFDTKK